MSGSGAGAFVRSRHAGIGRAFGSTTMAVYVIALLTIFLAPMLVNVLVVVITHPLIAPALAAPQATNWIIFIFGFATLVAIVVGGIRGPIAPGRFEAMVRLQSPQSRWKSLGLIALRALLSSTLALALLGLILGIAGSIAMHWPVSTVVWMGIAGFALGVAVSNARLLGQQRSIPHHRVRGRPQRHERPVGQLRCVLERGDSRARRARGRDSVAGSEFCLGRLRTETVLKHSALAEASSTLTKTGDWSAASREHRPAPSYGRSTRVLPRRLSASIPRTPWGLWLAAWRTRQRAYLGVFLIAVGALILGYGISLAQLIDTSRADLVIIGVVLAAALSAIYWGFGSFVESVEFAVETAGSVALFRLSAGALLVRTGAAYILLMLFLSLPLTAVLGYLVVNGDVGFLGPSLGGAIVLGLIQIALARIHSATEGPLPPQMTTAIRN